MEKSRNYFKDITQMRIQAEKDKKAASDALKKLGDEYQQELDKLQMTILQ